MSLYGDYKKQSLPPTEGLPESMVHAVEDWISSTLSTRVQNPYELAVHIKTKFHISNSCEIKRPHPYEMSDFEQRTRAQQRCLASFLTQVAVKNPSLFFIVVDYLLSRKDTFSGEHILSYVAKALGVILKDAGHIYEVQQSKNELFNLSQRLSDEEKKALKPHLEDDESVYSEHFKDGYVRLYGVKPDYTGAVNEFLLSLEAALKLHINPPVKAREATTGGIIAWLRDNPGQWRCGPSMLNKEKNNNDGKSEAQEYFISILGLTNSLCVGYKHTSGNENEKRVATKATAETVMRLLVCLLYILGNNLVSLE